MQKARINRANVKLVIEIDEEWLKDIKERIDNGCVDHEPWVAIANDTPLPKGHGRLIDADALLEKHRIDLSAVAPTIIEADKEE